jgi:hypothetical protein
LLFGAVVLRLFTSAATRRQDSRGQERDEQSSNPRTQGTY